MPRTAQNQAAVYQAIQQLPGGMVKKNGQASVNLQLTALTGLGPRQVTDAVSRLVHHGKLKRFGGHHIDQLCIVLEPEGSPVTEDDRVLSGNQRYRQLLIEKQEIEEELAAALMTVERIREKLNAKADEIVMFLEDAAHEIEAEIDLQQR